MPITFRQLREKTSPKAEVVYNKKMNGYPVKITKTAGKFHVVIDGDYLDDFDTEKQAIATAKQTIKALT